MSEPERRIETSDDITHCLLELAFHNNNATRASKKLRADGWKVDRFTLLELRKKHPDRYERAREAQRTASMADDAEELAHTYAGIERKAADMLELKANPDKLNYSSSGIGSPARWRRRSTMAYSSGASWGPTTWARYIFSTIFAEAKYMKKFIPAAKTSAMTSPL